MSMLTVFYNSANVEVYFTYDGGQVGSTDSLGLKYEPDFDEYIEIDEVVYNGIDIIPVLNDDNLDEIEQLVWAKIQASRNEYDGE